MSLQPLTVTFWSHVLLLVLLLPCGTYCALTNGEKEALLQIYNAYPALAYPPQALDYNVNKKVSGSQWNSNFNDLCSSDGYEYFGIHCLNGHIDGIDITDAWERPTGFNFSLISGLEYLTNVSVFYVYDTMASHNLSIALAKSTRAIHYDLGYQDFSASYFSFPEDIVTLNFISVDSHSLVNFTKLRNLRYGTSTSAEFPAEIIPSLHSLEILLDVNLTWFADNIQEFTSLTSLTIVGAAAETQSIGSIKFELHSLPLQSFSLTFTGSNSAPFQVVINSTTLTYFRGNLLQGAQLELVTPNLKDLLLMGFISLLDMTRLTQLETLQLGSFYTPPPLFPNLNFSSNMREFRLSQWAGADAENFERIICSLAESSQDTFELFEADNLDGYLLQQLPSCFSQFTNMKSFSWDSYSLMNPSSALNGTSVWSRLPRTLTRLYLHGAIADTAPLSFEVFATFPLLETLDVSVRNFIDTLREDFFETLPNLSDFLLLSENVNGTIPSKGWQNLKNVLIHCNCESWNSIDHAPNLDSLYVYSVGLTSIPHDVVFAAAGLVSLRDFTIMSDGNLGGPVPTFWSQLPNIRSVQLTRNNFQGPLSTLGPFASRDMRYITLSSNQLCALPEVPEPTSIYILSLQSNSITGTIPSSWGQNLVITQQLYLNDNPALTGPIPIGLMDQKRSRCPYVTFSNTRVSQFGALTCFPKDFSFSLLNNPIDLCQNSLALEEPIKIDCIFTNVSACPYTRNCLDQWSNCTTITCTERTFEPLSVTPCIEPPPRPIPASFNCPLPMPALGFICDDGKWIAPGNIHEPSLSLPPNYGIITINGSLYSGGVITFNGIGTQIEVNQCVQETPTLIVIELTEEDTPNSVTLLRQKGNNCPTDLSTIPIKVNSKNNSCKKTKASTSASTHSSLVVVFSVDSSHCNTKWIVLGSVLGSVAVIAVVTIILLDKYNPKFHKLITTGKFK